MTEDSNYFGSEDSSVRWVRQHFKLPRYETRTIPCGKCSKPFDADFKLSEKYDFAVKMQKYCWHCNNRMHDFI